MDSDTARLQMNILVNKQRVREIYGEVTERRVSVILAEIFTVKLLREDCQLYWQIDLQ